MKQKVLVLVDGNPVLCVDDYQQALDLIGLLLKNGALKDVVYTTKVVDYYGKEC